MAGISSTCLVMGLHHRTENASAFHKNSRKKLCMSTVSLHPPVLGLFVDPSGKCPEDPYHSRNSSRGVVRLEYAIPCKAVFRKVTSPHLLLQCTECCTFTQICRSAEHTCLQIRSWEQNFTILAMTIAIASISKNPEKCRTAARLQASACNWQPMTSV